MLSELDEGAPRSVSPGAIGHASQETFSSRWQGLVRLGRGSQARQPDEKSVVWPVGAFEEFAQPSRSPSRTARTRAWSERGSFRGAQRLKRWGAYPEDGGQKLGLRRCWRSRRGRTWRCCPVEPDHPRKDAGNLGRVELLRSLPTTTSPRRISTARPHAGDVTSGWGRNC